MARTACADLLGQLGGGISLQNYLRNITLGKVAQNGLSTHAQHSGHLAILYQWHVHDDSLVS